MTFLNGYLLGGLLLAGVPVLVHLIMRQKPRLLRFPAFRFLKQRHRTTKRKLRLQHLLLLLLRMAVIAALCLALARPRVQSGGLPLGGERAVDAVFVLDTSPSMDYVAGGKTRLDEARARARELLDEMADGSRALLLETGDEGGDGAAGQLSPNLGDVRTRLDALRTRAAGGPLNRPLERAARLLADLGDGEDAPPRVLYVFSDRTRACWDPATARQLKVPEGVTVVFVDVGVNDPVDLAVDDVKVDPPVAAPGDAVEVRVTLRATGGGKGADYSTTVGCTVDGTDEAEAAPQTVTVVKGQAPPPVVFRRRAPAAVAGEEGPCQVTVKLGTNDLLPYNNVRHATFLVREPRKVLTLVDDADDAERWDTALRVARAFRPRAVRPADAAGSGALKGCKVACLFQVSDPPSALLDGLKAFVEQGGGLVVVPGGAGLAGPKRDAFNRALAERGLLPAELVRLVTVPDPGKKKGLPWSRPFDPRHALTAYFARTVATESPDFGTDELWPFVNRYWQVGVGNDARVVASYDLGGGAAAPALVERTLGRGTVVEFTTALGKKEQVAPGVPWHNYWTDSSFGLVLANEVCRYLAGESTVPELNFLCGRPADVPLPSPPAGPFKLDGPDPTAAEAALEARDGRLTVTQATVPGNYLVRDGKGNVAAGFSLAVSPEEGVLERVPVADVEAVLGPGTVVEVGRTGSLRDALAGRWTAPVELLPWLMILLLVVLTAEGLFANKFYRRTDPAGGATEPAKAAS